MPNYLGIEVQYIVYGLSHSRTELAAELLYRNGKEGVVVTGLSNQGLRFDEVSILGPTKISRISSGKVETFQLEPGDMGLPLCQDDDVAAANSCQNAIRLVKGILQGRGNEAQNALVAANAGVLLWVGGHVKNLTEGTALASDTICSGKTWSLFEAIRKKVNLPPDRRIGK